MKHTVPVRGIRDSAPERHPPRKPYRKPRLIAFGDVRELTFGVTPGIGDSANPGIFRP